jgi:hypothetical protein
MLIGNEDVVRMKRALLLAAVTLLSATPMWSDGTTFYTTSDSKNDTPIYKYVRAYDSGMAVIPAVSVERSRNARLVLRNGQVLVLVGEKAYTLSGVCVPNF